MRATLRGRRPSCRFGGFGSFGRASVTDVTDRWHIFPTSAPAVAVVLHISFQHSIYRILIVIILCQIDEYIPRRVLGLSATCFARCFLLLRCLILVRILFTFPSLLNKLAERYEGPGLIFIDLFFYLSPLIKYLSQRWSKIRSLWRHLTVEERIFFSVAYRNIISARRASWRVVLSIEQREESNGNKAQISMIHIKDYWPVSLWCESLKSRVKWQVNLWHSQFAPLICFRGLQGVLLQNVSEF